MGADGAAQTLQPPRQGWSARPQEMQANGSVWHGRSEAARTRPVAWLGGQARWAACTQWQWLVRISMRGSGLGAGGERHGGGTRSDDGAEQWGPYFLFDF